MTSSLTPPVSSVSASVQASAARSRGEKLLERCRTPALALERRLATGLTARDEVAVRRLAGQDRGDVP
jgi:hypothetical protein